MITVLSLSLLFRFIVFSSATDSLAASVMFGDKVQPRRQPFAPCFPPNFVRPTCPFLSNCRFRINFDIVHALVKEMSSCEETLVRPPAPVASLPLAAHSLTHSLTLCLAFSIVACMSFHGEQRNGAARRGAARRPFCAPPNEGQIDSIRICTAARKKAEERERREREKEEITNENSDREYE